MKAIYIVCVIALLGAMMVAPAAATTWTVCSAGCDFASIDAATEKNAELADGDTVYVYNGSYSYTTDVVAIWKSITLKGEGADVVTWDAGGYSLELHGAGTVIEGLKIVNSDQGIEIKPTAPDCIIRNCVFEGVGGSGNYGPQLSGTNITFENNVISNATAKYAALDVRKDCTIVNNTIKGSTQAAGISLDGSSAINCIITKNNLTSNTYAGIELYNAGSGNKIYLNNLIDNGKTATTSGKPAPAVTYWNSTEQIEYVYGGTTYTNYLGNYWSTAYSGTDGDGDGIGDTSYTVPDSLGEDHRPLMTGFENYPTPAAAEEPDLTPTSIANDSLSAGVPAAITVNVSNIGSADAGSFNVSLKVEDTVIGNDTVASLGAGSSVPVVFIWTPDAAGSFNLTAIVDSDDAVAESDEANNGLTNEVMVTPAAPPAQFTLSVTVDPAGSGTVDMDPAGGTYDDGTPVTLTASAAAGYTFSHWSGDLIGSVNPETLTMDADKSVTANFSIGKVWSTMTSPTTERLYGVWGSSGSDVFAVGDAGTILHYDGTIWSTMTSPTTEKLYKVWGSSGSDVFAVGHSGTILHYDGASWSTMTSPTEENIYGVWGTSSSDVFAVGYAGTIIHYDGTSWSTMTSPTTGYLFGVWGSSGSDVFAVGDAGTILHYNGTDWSTMTSPTTWDLYGVWGTSSSDVFAVGTYGVILHYDGTSWSTVASPTITNSPTMERLYRIWGSSGSDVFAVATYGTILHYDGTSWSTMTSPTTEYLYKVWGSSGSDVFAVGRAGTILHYGPPPTPDLTPTSIANDSLSAGVPAAITVNVSNIGSADAGSFNVSLKVEDTVIGNDTVASLGAGSSVPVVFIWTPDAAGSFNLTAIVDSDDAVAESDEANNGLTREVTVEEPSTPTPATPALISGNVTYDNGNPVVNPAVTVTNLATSEDFTVKANASSNYYLTLTDSIHVTAGDTIRINTSDGTVSSETDHPVAASEITTGGFVQEMTIESGELPDLIVTEKSEEWISLADGTYNVTCTVANIGTSGADASTTAIEINGTVVATDPVPAIQVGENYTSTLGPFTLSGENDTIRVCADSGESINEQNETNNCLENLLEAPGMPDLIVWVALKTPGYVNEDNILGVRVKNTGTGDAGSFNVSLAIDGTPMPEQTVPPLAAGETTELEYAWTSIELGGHALSATVDTNNDVAESNETNNDYARTSVIIKRTDWYQFHYDEVHSGASPSGAPDTNETLWISDEISAIGGASTVVADGKVFAYGGPTSPSGSGDGALYCLDEFTGTILWNVSIPTPAYGSWSSPAYHNGRVFTSTDIEAGCYNATTGEQIWVFENPTGEPSVGGGPIVADGKVIVNDWQAGHFYCLDEETGELLWTFTEEQIGSWSVGYTQGVPAYEDGKFYFTTWLYVGGNVYCVDADTGEEIWNQTTPLDTCGSPAVVDGTVYVTNYNFYGDGEIYAMNATDGSILWHQTIQRTDSTPAVAYGNVYVTGGCRGYSNRQTYCFNATTGDLEWSTDPSDTIGSWTCSVAVADGKVFVGTEGSTFFDYAGTYALDAFTGNVVWSYPEGGSSPAVADNIVFTGGGGRVYAFYTSKPDLTVAAIETPANLRSDVINPITATIENIGGTNAENFDVSLAVDGIPVDTATIATLAAGENTTVEFLWTPSSTGNATLTMTADANDDVTESDESNNNLSQTADVLEKLTVTANVRIEGKNETVWTGDVTFSNSTIMASDGSIHYLNEPTALGALDCADRIGGFGYVAENSVYGLYVSEVNNEPPIGWDGWMYRVNYVSPSVGAPDYTLADSDEVLWYFGAWTAPPLAIELIATEVSPGEEFVATVTAYNGTSAEFEPVDNATVYADGLTFETGIDGNATLLLDTAGNYTVYADKGTWADYTRSEKVEVRVTIPAGVTIKPETLNLKSKGKFTAFITLPEGYDVADIVVSTVECEGAPALSGTISAADSGTLVVKFDRADLVGVPIGDEVEMTVTGELFDGTVFEGSDLVRVIEKGKK